MNKEIKTRDAEMTKILSQPVSKVQHRWAERNFNGIIVTVMQSRRFTYKDFELKCGAWRPQIENITKTYPV